ncbi:tyrosinase family protein [Streptomyces nojiriensis]|uniref:tyrosinase family protein n=1 Tax=Streptomyces nojiriensis TaxID=66374 RepID=UPI002E177918
MVRSRRDVNSLSPTELSDYIHAIDILRARSTADPDDVSGYDFQAALHNDGSVGPCERGSDLFLPWHRAHLHYFEKLLQAADPPRTADVTVPYWDWIHAQATGKFPAAFSQPGLDSGRNENLSTPLPANTLDIVLHESNQAEFGGYVKGSPIGNKGRLERGPHDYMHPHFIGGLMSNPTTAAMDPIYFSFHCFIDLLWPNGSGATRCPPPPLRRASCAAS